jgi:serine protease Do
MAEKDWNASRWKRERSPKVKKQRVLTILTFFSAAMVAGFLGGMVTVHSHSLTNRKAPQAIAQNTAARVADVSAVDLPQARVLADQLSAVFEAASDRVSPSVVAIFSEQTVDVAANDPFHDFFQDPFFRRFFGGPGAPGGKETVRGLGSGVIVSPDGYILTNNHVVQGASKLTVALSDKKRLDAKIVGTDPQTDVAVIKVDAEGLPAATLGDSDNVHVGQWVIAVGNPFQLMHTVTAGIISAKGRSSVGLADYEDFIQTDASINPGNSGGALADLDGNVVAINTAISSPSGGNVGIGFAIPIKMARNVMDTLIKKGHVSRGYLGLMLQQVDDKLAKALHLAKAEGVIVSDVNAGGPADRAGIRTGDVILSFDGKPVNDIVELRNAVAQMAPGTSVHLGLIREGKKMDVVTTLGERPQEGAEAAPGGEGSQTTSGELGLAVQDLTPSIASQLGYDENLRGALVADVEGGSVADEAGLRRGDVIVGVNRQPIRSAADLAAAIKGAKSGDSIAMLVRRGQGSFYVPITMP